MRIYLSVDMEGATGVVHRDQLVPEGKDYEKARKLLTGDVLAALEGAIAAGATELLVNDGHGNMRNILIDDFPPEASLISGPASTRNKPLCQTQEADAGWDLAFLVAYHARAGTVPGLLAHTWVGSLIHEVRVNGEVLGETGISATVLGHYGIPVGLVTGADDVVAEAKAIVPHAETVAVKHAIGFSAAACMSPARTKERIRDAARRAVERRGEMVPMKVGSPVTFELELHTRLMAEKGAAVEGVERTGERCIAATAPTAPEAAAAAWRAVEAALREDSPWLA